MPSIKQTLISIALMSLVLPPDAMPSSSDGFPWSSSSNTNGTEVEPGVKRDAYGALRDSNMSPDTVSPAVTTNQNSNGSFVPLFTPGNSTRDGRDQRGATMQEGVIAPGGTISASGVAQGNVGPTQSGPGAAGLFTPNSPGNAAAYNAQVQGGLSASPIVDGNGANVHVTVPMANPSRVQVYQQDNYGGSGGAPEISTPGGGAKQSAFDYLNSARNPRNRMQMGRDIVPVVHTQPASFVNNFATPRISINKPASMLSASRVLSRSTRSKNSRSIGEVTGSITYGDGQKVVLGSRGSAIVNPKH